MASPMDRRRRPEEMGGTRNPVFNPSVVRNAARAAVAGDRQQVNSAAASERRVQQAASAGRATMPAARTAQPRPQVQPQPDIPERDPSRSEVYRRALMNNQALHDLVARRKALVAEANDARQRGDFAEEARLRSEIMRARSDAAQLRLSATDQAYEAVPVSSEDALRRDALRRQAVAAQAMIARQAAGDVGDAADTLRTAQARDRQAFFAGREAPENPDVAFERAVQRGDAPDNAVARMARQQLAARIADAEAAEARVGQTPGLDALDPLDQRTPQADPARVREINQRMADWRKGRDAFRARKEQALRDREIAAIRGDGLDSDIEAARREAAIATLRRQTAEARQAIDAIDQTNPADGEVAVSPEQEIQVENVIANALLSFQGTEISGENKVANLEQMQDMVSNMQRMPPETAQRIALGIKRRLGDDFAVRDAAYILGWIWRNGGTEAARQRREQTAAVLQYINSLLPEDERWDMGNVLDRVNATSTPMGDVNDVDSARRFAGPYS